MKKAKRTHSGKGAAAVAELNLNRNKTDKACILHACLKRGIEPMDRHVGKTGHELAEYLGRMGVRFVYGLYKNEVSKKPLEILTVNGDCEDHGGFLLDDIRFVGVRGSFFLGVKGAGKMGNGNYLHIIDIDDMKAAPIIWGNNQYFFKNAIRVFGSRGFHIYIQCPKPIKTKNYEWGELIGKGGFAFTPPSRNLATKRPYVWIDGDEVPIIDAEVLKYICAHVYQTGLSDDCVADKCFAGD